MAENKKTSEATKSIFNKIGSYLAPQPGKTRPIDVIRELPKAIYQTQGGPQLESSAKTIGESAFAMFPSKEYKALEDRGEMTPSKQQEIIPSVKKSLGKIIKELSFGVGGPLGLASMASYLGDYRVMNPKEFASKSEIPQAVSDKMPQKKILKPSVAKHLLSDAAGQVDYVLNGNLRSGSAVSPAAKAILNIDPNNITGKEHLASIIQDILVKHKLVSNQAVAKGIQNTLSNFTMFKNNGINPFVYLIK